MYLHTQVLCCRATYLYQFIILFYRVNLRYGIKAGKVKQILDTCTACAGTMILEFAA